MLGLHYVTPGTSSLTPPGSKNRLLVHDLLNIKAIQHVVVLWGQAIWNQPLRQDANLLSFSGRVLTTTTAFLTPCPDSPTSSLLDRQDTAATVHTYENTAVLSIAKRAG